MRLCVGACVGAGMCVCACAHAYEAHVQIHSRTKVDSLTTVPLLCVYTVLQFEHMRGVLAAPLLVRGLSFDLWSAPCSEHPLTTVAAAHTAYLGTATSRTTQRATPSAYCISHLGGSRFCWWPSATCRLAALLLPTLGHVFEVTRTPSRCHHVEDIVTSHNSVEMQFQTA